MVSASRKFKKILQTGSMQRSSYNFRHAVDLIRNGYLGKIEKAIVNVGNPSAKCNLPYQPTPSTIDWDRWIGPAQMRSYHSTLVDADFFPRWRWYKEFGGGILADWGAHMFDIVQWALDMDNSGPVKLVPPREPNAVRGLQMTYKNGVEVVHEDFYRGFGVRFIGSKGTLDVSREYLDSNIKGLVKKSLKNSATRVYFSDDHLKDWITSIKNNSLPICDVEIGHRSASVCQLGNIAYELRETLNWDPVKEEFIDNSRANFLKTKFYRKPYTL
jgi:predicted dehydrogenase